MGNKFQRFLWTVAGAELDILEKCRTDHKKFSAIGATILMTAFIAFCAGTSAAWYFTQSGDESSGSLGWAMLFGLIWSLLIFCIDHQPRNRSSGYPCSLVLHWHASLLLWYRFH